MDLIALALGKPMDDEDLQEALYEVCDSVHSSCSNDCPVYELNGGCAPGSDKPFEENRGCDTFKNGTAMLEFIREKSK